MEKKTESYNKQAKLTDRISELEKELAIANEKIESLTEREKNSVSKYKTLFEGINDAVFVMPLLKEGFANFLEVNDIACKRLGYTREELLELSPKEISTPADVELQGSKKNREKLLKNRWSVFETVHITKTGEHIPVEINSSILYLEGEIVAISLSRDITERVKAAELLTKSKNKYKTLFEKSTDAMQLLKNGKFIDCNQANVNLFKSKDKAELLQIHPSELSPEKQRDGSYSNEKESEMLKILFEKGSNRFEWDHVNADGEVFSAEVSLTAITDEDGSQLVHAVLRDITERILTEEEYRDSEEQFRILMEQSPIPIQIFDINGFIIKANKAWVDLWEIADIEKVLGNFNILKDSQIKEMGLLDKFKKAFAGEQIDIPNIIFDPNVAGYSGRKRFINVRAYPLKKNDGSFSSIVFFNEDVTAREMAQEAFRSSEKKFRTIIENSTDVISILDETGKVTFESPSHKRVLGYNSGELIGKNIFELVHPEDLERISQQFGGLLQRPRGTEQINFRFLHKNESWLHLEGTGSNLLDVPNINGIVVNYRDVTNRKKREHEILKLSNAVEQAQVSIVITNVDGNVEYVNPKFTEVTGYTFEEVYNQNPRVLKSGEQSNEYYKTLWKTILSGNIWSGEFHNKKKNGEPFWESSIISPVKDGDGKITHFVAIKEDITEKKAMLEELIDSKEKAENADKMKSIFLAQMSHEIRTPINALVSMTSLLRYDFEESADEDQLMSFDIIDRAGGRIIRTVDLLLNLSEIQAGTYETHLTKFDLLTEVISQIVAENKMLAKNKNIDLHLIYSVESSELFADYYTVNQIFIQLIDNAIKYTEEGKVKVKILRNKLYQLVVEIEDTGIGIEEEYLTQIFKPFIQEEMGYTRKYEGNGIGLTLVKKYCELNNAKIEVESEKDVGSLFRVIFH